VTCARVNAFLEIPSVSVTPDGKTVTFTFNSMASEDMDMLWFRVSIYGGLTMTTIPTVDGNLRGEKVFVVGPFPRYQSRQVSLSFANFPNNGYTFWVDFLQVFPRVAFASNRANPSTTAIQEIYTLAPENGEVYTVTSNSISVNTKPVWSPGGEWIAYERLTPTPCPAGLYLPPQVALVHPDGSTAGFGGVISQNLYLASDPTFNPTGELLAYQGRLQCEGTTIDPDIRIDLYLYNIKQRTQKMWFSGQNFQNRQLFLPEWSPDGRYVIMAAVNAGGVIQWYYAPVDPLTGDTIQVLDPATGNPAPLPIRFLRNGKNALMPDGKYHILQVFDWAWAPDSRHAAVRCDDLVWVPSPGKWVLDFAGVVIIDFNEVLQTPLANLPIVPQSVRVADKNDGNVNYQGFSRDATQLCFDNYFTSSRADLEYVELDDYQPLAPHSRVTFLSDGHFNRTPALWPPALMEYFNPAP
jgi:dipeptidyl aminopeptidase/acylaminoacyl peptidase